MAMPFPSCSFLLCGLTSHLRGFHRQAWGALQHGSTSLVKALLRFDTSGCTQQVARALPCPHALH